ncbi:M1 family metallopeptidase [Lewinella cohaerens]|uniref:M1 family metallopeptidase n=1 Tax=Lewinella cohaerens TaxID=70995 RepID=UPI0003621FD6|nr:M1 family metallopeptidase [Lewinella cohaerens]
MRPLLILFFLLSASLGLQGQSTDFYQHHTFTKADTLRGSLRSERTCYDVHYYGLQLKVDPRKRMIRGEVEIAFTTVTDFQRLQIDLFENMTIDRILLGKQELSFSREYNAVFVDFPTVQQAGDTGSFTVHYYGKPTIASNAPWDGGFVWAEDKRGRNWIAVACEGDGASLWWPNKDHLSDEPDSMLISLTVPSNLMAVANGNLREVEEEDKYTRYDWFVSYPIDNYNVTLNIGHYTQFSDEYYAADGDTLALDYYVIDYNEDRAREHFQQVHSVLACYEKYLDKYPFWEDGFALVETPYLGMEHQSAIAYGNQYMRGYQGGMIPNDMDWDYIIVHETGHEYFGNSIGVTDLAEMWVQESFTTYLEAVYVEYTMSYEDAIRYLVKQKLYIYNQEPIIGPPGVNWENWGGSDHYFKGAWVLHTLRNAIGDDEKWWAIFKGFYQKHSLSLVSTQDFIDYVNEATGEDWQAFFQQYLHYPQPPVLEYKLTQQGKKLQVSYRWAADAEGFNMPILLGNQEKMIRVTPNTTKWQETTLFNTTAKDFTIAVDRFLVKTKEIE